MRSLHTGTLETDAELQPAAYRAGGIGLACGPGNPGATRTRSVQAAAAVTLP